MTVTFHADGSSYQGTINWAAVKRAGFGGGAEKVTEGTGYVNPFWPAARSALLAEAGPDFTPSAYLYLDAGDGAAQADYFAAEAGSLPGCVIWVDLERAAGPSPSVAEAQACTARLRVHYPHNRVGIYAGESYTGTASLTFADLLWSPHYVGGTGTPAGIYKSVPASFWAPYGGRTPVMVQFSQSATVPGVAGQADCSAFLGTPAQMRAALLGIPVPPKPSPVPTAIPEDDMLGIVYPPKTAATGLPAGKTWPGEFVTDGFRLRHVNPTADGIDNVAAWLALGAKGPAEITWAEYVSLGGT